MNDLSLKYSLLDKTSKKEVNDFIDFLLEKIKDKRKKNELNYRERLLSVSVWNKKDIEIFDSNKSHFNKWKIEKW